MDSSSAAIYHSVFNQYRRQRHAMFIQTLWVAGLLFESLLLYRGWKARLFSRYPVFFLYILYVLLQSLLRRATSAFFPDFYATVYWATEFIGVFVGCAIVFEFFKIALAKYPGVAKLARNALMLVFALTIGKVLLTASQVAEGWSGVLTIQLERDMRFVQIAAVATLLSLLLIYAIPAGRNLLGIVLGYGVYLAIVVLNLTYLDHFGDNVLVVARFVQSTSYLMALVLWTIMLWSYRPAVETSPDIAAAGYGVLHDSTTEKLSGTRLAVRSAIDN